ncbi:MAG: ATP-binding protein [Thermodesulfobacteriota bacterium]
MLLGRVPIIWKLGLHIFFAGMLVVSLLAINIKGSYSLTGDVTTINYAGSERMRMYKIFVLLKRYAGEMTPENREAVEAEMESFGEILYGLRFGDPAYGLKGNGTGEIRARLDKCIGWWEGKGKPLFSSVLDAPAPEEAERMLAEAGFEGTVSRFVEKIDGTVKLMEENTSKKVRTYLLLQYLIMAFIAGIAVSSLVFTRRIISVPIERLRKTMREIAGGDLSARVTVDTRDEIGDLGEVCNIMAWRLMETQEAMLERERLAALGEFSLGIAHEIRNPLSSVRMNLQALFNKAKEEGGEPDAATPDATTREQFTIALREVDHLDGIVREIMNFARPPVLCLSSEDVSDIIDASLRMAEKELGDKKVEVVKDVPEDMPLLPVDAVKIKQVLLNIILNAVHAMGEGGRLKVFVSVGGGEVSISVEDNGRGMVPEVKKRIFDPFFTTHPGGMGMGMALVRNIVEQHGGRIELESTPGEGTKVTVTLPEQRT